MTVVRGCTAQHETFMYYMPEELENFRSPLSQRGMFQLTRLSYMGQRHHRSDTRESHVAGRVAAELTDYAMPSFFFFFSLLSFHREERVAVCKDSMNANLIKSSK